MKWSLSKHGIGVLHDATTNGYHIKVGRDICSESQDGRWLIGAYFTRGTAHLKRFMRTSRRNRIAGIGLIMAWESDPNLVIQLIVVDRATSEAAKALVIKLVKKAKKFFKGVNDVYLDQTACSENQLEYELCVFKYSCDVDGSQLAID